MSGTIRPPANGAESMRELVRRVGRLENPQTARVGDFVFSVQDGALVITKPGVLLEAGQAPAVTVDLSNIRGTVTSDLEKKITAAVTGDGDPGPLDQLADFIEDKWDDLTGVGTGVRTVVDNIRGALTGFFDAFQPASQDEAQQALIAHQRTVAQTAVTVAEITSRLNPASQGGNFQAVRFADYSPSTNLPADFTQTYYKAGTGSVGILDSRAQVTDVGNKQDRWSDAIYNVAHAETWDMVVRAVFDSIPGRFTSGFTNYKGQHGLYVRANEDGTDNITVQFLDVTAQLGFTVASSTTYWGSPTSHTFQPGSVYALVAGTLLGHRRYQVTCNDVLVSSWIEVGTSSAMDDDHRSGGFSQLMKGDGNQTALPGKLRYFDIGDNLPPVVLGTKAKVRRLSTSDVSHVSSTLSYNIATNFFDDVEYITSDVTWDSPTNSFQVSKEGTYIVHARIKCDTRGAGFEGGLVVSVNFDPYEKGDGSSSSITGSGTQNWQYSAWEVYLHDGDRVSLGYWSDSSIDWTGSADGVETYFKITKVDP